MESSDGDTITVWNERGATWFIIVEIWKYLQITTEEYQRAPFPPSLFAQPKASILPLLKEKGMKNKDASTLNSTHHKKILTRKSAKCHCTVLKISSPFAASPHQRCDEVPAHRRDLSKLQSAGNEVCVSADR